MQIKGGIKMNELITMDQLAKKMKNEDLIIIDCRYELNNSEAGREMYQVDHIPNSIFFDLGKDLSGPKLEHGGRHPLPDMNNFIKKLGEVGIDKTKHVVAYDDQKGAFAARLWWMLKYLGHDNVSVLNVNYSTWKEKGYPITNETPVAKQTHFIPKIRSHMVVDVNQVKQAVEDDKIKIIDSRAPERYRGEIEPLDKKAGHIPSAENWFWEDNVESNGNWKSKQELKERFSSLENEDLIIYCGSGVTANVNILALANLGKEASLYLGGWSDWSSYEDNQVVTKNN